MAGIVSYGVYIPKYRIESKEIARIWGDDESIGERLMIYSKSVPNIDEDTVTISVESARMAVNRGKIKPEDIGAIYVGSESHPYAVKPTATIVGEAIGAAPNFTAADFEFACKAGTAAIQCCIGLVESNIIKYGLAIGADTSQSAPGDALEYAASAGAASYIIGREKIIANINHTTSYTTDTPDFWRRDLKKYPKHGERFTGEPAYFKHIMACSKILLGIAGTKPEDYKYAVFHQPNGKFPLSVGKMLGFTEKQIKQGLLTPTIGNTYSGSMPLGLAAILDVAEIGDRIFAVSYGSGAGSDGFDITVTENIDKIDRTKSIELLIKNTKIIDYSMYAKNRELLHLAGE